MPIIKVQHNMKITNGYNVSFSIETVVQSEQDCREAGISDAESFKAYMEGLGEGAENEKN